MESQVEFAYFYNKQNKTESFGTITQEHNWGAVNNDAEKAARQVLPKRIEEYHILKVTKQAPFGSFLSDTLSINFSEILDRSRLFDQTEPIAVDDINRLLVDASPLTAWKGIKDLNDISKYDKTLYMIRRYIEMCIDRPRLYSFGQFQQLLAFISEEPWHPQTLGFFAFADEAATGQVLFNDGKFHRTEYYAKYYGGNNSLSDLDGNLEYAILGGNSEDILPAPVVEVFWVSDVVDAVLLSLFHLLQEKTAIKKCANCGKLFVPLARADAIYCDRPAPQDSTKTCKEYGSKVLWYENVVSDDVAKLARNIYCAKQMLAKRNPDKPEYTEMFKYFQVEKKKWEQQVKAGEKTREEFSAWLRTMKLCKTLGELERS